MYEQYEIILLHMERITLHHLESISLDVHWKEQKQTCVTCNMLTLRRRHALIKCH